MQHLPGEFSHCAHVSTALVNGRKLVYVRARMRPAVKERSTIIRSMTVCTPFTLLTTALSYTTCYELNSIAPTVLLALGTPGNNLFVLGLLSPTKDAAAAPSPGTDEKITLLRGAPSRDLQVSEDLR